MKNRLFGLLVLLSIILVFSLSFPFERDIAIGVDKKYANGLKEIDIIFVKDDKVAYENRYFPKENFFKFNTQIEDKIRLARGKYNIKIYLIYKDAYVIKENQLEIKATDFSKEIRIGE